MTTRILTTVVAAALAVAGLTGCSVSVAPAQQAAYDVLTEIVALQKQNPVEQAELAYKTPTGVVLYVEVEPGEQPDPRFIVVAVNLADGVVFGEQYPSGTGVTRFESLEEYAEWDWRTTAVPMPDIPSYAGAYADNVDRAQRLYYDERGTFATDDVLLEWSRSDANLAPDLALPENYRLDITADADGYLTLVNSPIDDHAVIALGYCASTPDSFLDDLAALDDARAAGEEILLGCLVPTGGGYRAEPFDYVTPDPAVLDDDGRVPAVELPEF